ncbi:MAG: hypothetical protein JF564_03770 [Sphingomonas sp.]|nr:hypothetical protein [Sphingomonas sp.]
MADGYLDGVVDLFGDPVPASRGKKGRPPHLPTAENRRFVQVALACGRIEEDIAKALRITQRTLNKHYFHELSGKASARMRLEMKNMTAMVEQVEKGNVSAMSLLAKRLDKIEQRDLARQMSTERPSAPRPLGKKEAAAQTAGQHRGLYEPPAGPERLN